MMGIFKRTKNATQGVTLQQLIDFLNIGGVDASKLSEATYFACLRTLSEAVGKLPIKLLRHTKNGGIEKAYNHPLYNIVGSRPNPYTAASLFWSSTEINRNHFGNVYIWITGFGSSTKLWLLPHEQVAVKIDDGNLWGSKNAVWYEFDPQNGGQTILIPHDSMIALHASNSFNGVVSKSVRDTLASTFDGNLKAQQMLNRAYDNGFTSKVAVQYTGDLNDANEEKLLKHIRKFTKGEFDDGLVPLMPGVSLNPIDTKLADNQFVELKKYSALQVAAAFGIKPNQINDYEKSSYASAEAQQLAFYVDTLLYILKQYEEELSDKLLTAEERKNGYFFKFNVQAILRADLKTQIESLKSGVDGSLYTPDEARSLLDLPAMGCNELMCNGTMIPVKMIGEQYAKGGE